MKRATSTDDFMALGPLADAVGVEIGDVALAGDLGLWRGPFAIDDVAVSSVIVALSAAAELLAVRNGQKRATVELDTRHAAASFLSDAFVEPIGWELPPVWDSIAGDYRTIDGWIRLHTNYVHHRSAALIALGMDSLADVEPSAVAAVVAKWTGDDLEAAVVSNGGAAARQRSREDWNAHAVGMAVNAEPLLDVELGDDGAEGLGLCERPFDGVRVLDLTRVLAGPTATGFLAAWGADVLRIDPPGFQEVPAIVPVTTCGKRTAVLDLRGEPGRQRFLELLRTADVVVHGYRSDALSALGLDPMQWHRIRPGLVEVSLNAYGWRNPWTGRRGFDSLVQHSSGITAHAQRVAATDRPVPLPCQALDYGTGWLLASAVAAGLAQRCRTRRGSTSKTSLARFAALVTSVPAHVDHTRASPTVSDIDSYLTLADTAWGTMRRLPWPGAIGDFRPLLGTSHAIGTHDPEWQGDR